MADRHRATEAERRRALADLLQVADAELAGLVQVNVEPDAAPFGDGEDAVELALGIAVDLRRVDAADEIGAHRHRLVEQGKDAGAAHDAALREGDDGQPDLAAEALAHGDERLDLREPAFEIDVGVRADMRGALADAEIDEVAGALGDRRQLAPRLLVVLDAAHPRAVAAMRPPVEAVDRLVEMDMAVDQAGEDEVAADIENDGRVVERTIGRTDLGDTPVDDADMRDAPVRKTGVGKKRLGCHRSFSSIASASCVLRDALCERSSG